MALSITDLKKGAIFEQDGVPYKVVEYSQKVMGRGGSIVSVRVKSLLDGKVLDKTFKGNETIEPADVTSQTAQYLYNDGRNFYFMNPVSFDQFEVPAEIAENAAHFLKEGDSAQLQLHDGRVINLELAKNVPLKITYCESVVKGDTSTSVTKDAQTETGLRVRVPAFIKTGDVIRVDTRTGAYLERVKE